MAAILLTVAASLAVPFGLMRVWPVAGIIALPIWLPVPLAVLFRLIDRRSAPD